ncbi:sporulation membrane protein YtaF [Clostridium akagii]|uniref:sporulation membrane protein YtaF n=1 Tax=Clostridium akagii TaxID=91623 RepID=UPI00056611FA|nr:sporulation membrane protein YtaF [Clostridium akagii]
MIKSYFVVMMLLAVVSNTDNFAVGISYGTRKMQIPFISNLIIAFITGLGTLISMLLGSVISNVLNQKQATFLGSIIIIVVGCWIFVKEMRNIFKDDSNKNQSQVCKIEISSYGSIGKIPKILENPFLADLDFSGYISVSESIILGCALALNNMANGIGAGLAGINPFVTSIFAFIISLLSIWAGIKLGHDYIQNFLGKLSAPLAGIILIIIGIYEIIF